MSKESRERWRAAQAEVRPWHRQEAEPEDAWAAFQSYRDQGAPRSFTRLVGRTQKIYDWANTFAWRERVLAWDRHVDGLRQAEREEVLAQNARDVAAQHMAILGSAKSLASRELAKLNKLSEDSGDMPGPFTLSQVTRLTDTAIKLDRLVRGESTEHVKTTIDLSKLTDEELDQYEKLLQKVSPTE
jgi:hypothetical protein